MNKVGTTKENNRYYPVIKVPGIPGYIVNQPCDSRSKAITVGKRVLKTVK